jgi:predicted dehydrogenase
MLNWGIIGAGGIARVFCNAMQFSKTGRMVAVASNSAEKALEFATDFSLPKHYGSYEALLADESIDAVYIANIHPMHKQWAVAAAQAGKHLLVEKPIAMNEREVVEIIDAARANDVFLMEAFMYRCHPQMQKLAELVQAGAIGQVRMIRSVFSFNAAFDPTKRSYNREMGGGGIMDVGCYPASFARLVAGAAAGKPFLDPIEVKGAGKVGPTGVDHYAAATLKFENDIIAEIITGIACQLPTEATVFGDDGYLSVANPWLPSSPCRFARKPLPADTVFPLATLTLHRYATRQTEEITVASDRDLFAYEADMVGDNIAARQAPAMSWDDTLGNMRLLDRWRQEVGVIYPQDEE